MLDKDNFYYKNIIENKFIIDKSVKKYYDKDDLYYNNYGNTFDDIFKSLSQTDLTTLRMLVNVVGFNNIRSVNDVIALIDIIKNPRYKSFVDSIISRGSTSTNINNIIKTIQTPSSQSVSIAQTQDKGDLPQEEVKPKERNTIVDRFMNDILNKQMNPSFRGWVLPNGQLVSQFNDSIANNGNGRQDHSKLVKIFMSGLEEYDKDAHEKVTTLYREYVSAHGLAKADFDESFAVEVLGWVQISVVGRKMLACRGERWQDRIIRPFVIDYGFGIEISDFGRSYELEFAPLYDHINEIIELGLEKKYVQAK